MRKNTKGFTLAEVLITLGIIGVIAAITIPVIIGKYKRLQVETGLVVAYDNLKQIISASEEDHGSLEEWPILTRVNLQKNGVEKEIAEEYFVPYIQGSGYDYTSLSEFGDNTSQEDKYPVMRLPNGMIVTFSARHNRWGMKDESKPDGYDYVQTPVPCIVLYVDINGLKKPNKVNQDIFAFALYPEIDRRLVMEGELTLRADVDPENYTRSDLENAFNNNGYSYIKRELKDIKKLCMSDGYGCSAWIMRNGWKIPKGYPWL